MSEEMLADAIFRVVRQERQSTIDYMSGGNVKSHEHYRELMGAITAYNHVEQELKSLLRKQEYDDE